MNLGNGASESREDVRDLDVEGLEILETHASKWMDVSLQNMLFPGFEKVDNDENEINKHRDPDWEGSTENSETNRTEDLSSNIAVLITQKGTGDTQREEENTINELGRVVNKRRKTAERDEWFDERNKKLRDQGKSYVGWSREGKKRKIGAGRGKGKWGHLSFGEEMNWDQTKSVHSIADQENNNKTMYNKSSEQSHRAATLTYTIKTADGQILTVCKKTFLSTKNGQY
ncbi:hypothetical protein PR048_023492 [Dryococelus australis]|uniref:Uncharacterized protein n=1 Tax=Dryococelus australis TaxID=614101 RepID=A0ABQ9GU88_9NEOP|nr:hypothetical protein PR048_023492 [Dryococelus australis]